MEAALVRLPTELLFCIFCRLTPKELVCVALSCKSVSLIAFDDQVWRALCRSEWAIPYQISDSPRVRRRLDWKGIFKRRTIVDRNWKAGKYKLPEITIKYSSEITCIQTDEERIATGSYDRLVKMWDVSHINTLASKNEGKIEGGSNYSKMFVGHENRVYWLQFEDNTLVTGSDDNTMRIWNIEEEKCCAVLQGHARPIRCFQFNKRRLISGSYDMTIREWNMDSGTELHKEQAHTYCICCLKFDEERIVTGAFKEIKVWDARTFKCTSHVVAHDNWVTTVQFNGNVLATGSMDTSIKIWDLRMLKKEVRTLKSHQKRVRCLQFDDRKLCSGSYDYSVKLWDWKTGTCFATLDGHEASARSISYSGAILCSGSLDQTFKIWDFGMLMDN